MCVKGKGRGHFFGQGSSAPLARGQIDQNKWMKKIERQIKKIEMQIQMEGRGKKHEKLPKW